MKNEKDLAKEVANGINNMCFDRKAFCEQMGRAHRTLQADFTTLCIAWLNKCRDKYEAHDYDARNEYACEIGKLLMDYKDSPTFYDGI